MKVGLALGGGGVRGIAHIGVLEVLEQERIPIDLIVGTSFGSIIGAMYASRPSILDLKQRLIPFLEGPAFQKTRMDFLRRSFAEGKKARLLQQLKSYARRGILMGISFAKGYFIAEEEFRRLLCELIEDLEIEQTRIPFRCVAADLVKGKPVVLTKGSLRQAIQASCSIPGIFQPIRQHQAILVDGGWVSPVPVAQTREAGVDVVVAVDTSKEIKAPEEFTSGLQLVVRSHDMTKRVLHQLLIRDADVVIRPKIGQIHWTQFDKAPECIRRGHEAALAALPRLRRTLEKHKRARAQVV